jgi:hypothetical protein
MGVDETSWDTDEIALEPDQIPHNRPESGGQTDQTRRNTPPEHLSCSVVASMSASSLFANLFTNSEDDLGLPESPPGGDA